jgi:hypothetical protein
LAQSVCRNHRPENASGNGGGVIRGYHAVDTNQLGRVRR